MTKKLTLKAKLNIFAFFLFLYTKWADILEFQDTPTLFATIY